MKKQMTYIFLVTIVMTISGLSQDTKLSRKSYDSCRSIFIGQFLGEAKKSNLKLNENSLTIESMQSLLLTTGAVAEREKLTAKDLQKGADVGFLFVDSASKLRVPNGFYRIQVTQTNGDPKSVKTNNYKATLISQEGRVVGQLPILSVREQGGPQAFIVGTACWVGGTRGVCFAAGTSTFQIRLWEWFYEI